MFLFGLLDVLTVGSPLRFAGKRVVVCRKHLLNEVVHLRFHLADTSPVSKVGQQANVSTAVGNFCFPVHLPLQAFSSGRNGCSANGYLFLLVVMILLGMNDTVADRK